VSATTEMKRLEEQHRQGMISDAEFAASRRRLLTAAMAQTRTRSEKRTSSAWAPNLDLSDGRLLLAAGSVLILGSLLLPWADLSMARFSGSDLFRLVLGEEWVLRDLGFLFDWGAEAPAGSKVTVAAVAALIVGAATAFLWPQRRLRNLQAFVAASLLVLVGIIVVLRIGAGRETVAILGGGALLFIAGVTIVQLVSAALLVVNSLEFTDSSSGPLPLRIARSRRGRRFMVLAILPVVVAPGAHWFLYPTESSGPIVIEYQLQAFSDDGWAPQRAGSILVRSLGEAERIPLPEPTSTPSASTTMRYAAGSWTSGSSVEVVYEPAFTESRSLEFGIRASDQFDEAGSLVLRLPDRPTWRSRFSQQELVIRVEVSSGRTGLVTEHDDFGVLSTRSLRRVNEVAAVAAEQQRRDQEALVQRQVQASCLALQSEWQAVFAEFNRAEETIFGREWGFTATTRSWDEWNTRANNIINGLARAFSATSRERRSTSAQPVPGSGSQIDEISSRAATRVDAQRQEIQRYLSNWYLVENASWVRSESQWRSSTDQISELRRRARAGTSIGFGC
jgi:hypothetical protein